MKRLFAIALTLIAIALTTMALSPNRLAPLNDHIKKLLTQLKEFNEQRPEDRLYVQTDKPMYKPGETVWFSAYVRDAKLLPSEVSGIVHAELLNPKGGIDQQIKLIADNGVAKGDFAINDAAVGGMYKLKCYTNWQKNDPNPAFFIKEIQVQKVVLPRLKMKLDFEREAYGSGDAVTADLSLHSNDNKALASYNFNYIVQLDGAQILQEKGNTNAEGEAKIKFNLPNNLTSNDGLLNVLIDYQGMRESISRSVPIVLNTIELALYPEGGDLVSGLTGKVAFKALNEFGLPADIEGIVVNKAGATVANLKSYHQGMGAFEITPNSNEKYTVKITKPVGVTQTFELPKPLKKGYALAVNEVTEHNLVIDAKSSENEELYAVVNIRGENYYSGGITARPGNNLHRISTKKMPAGVAQITLFDSKGIARAERLTFINKHQQLNIDITTDKEKYRPREQVEMTINVTDQRGVPMPADLSVAVADDQLLTFADDKSSNILSWLLMEADLAEEVEEPNFYFDPTAKKADLALDYLLMTSGWRRFTWDDIQGDIAGAKFPAESNQISGIVVDWKGEPVSNSIVKIKGQDIQQKTNAEGQFTFKNAKLYEPVHLIAENKKQFDGFAVVKNYKKNITITPIIEGTVTNEEGEPLPGVVISYDRGGHGGMTDIDGKYKMRLPNNLEDFTIHVYYTGYESQKIKMIKMGEKSDFDIVMKEGSQVLDEVVVTGLGDSHSSRDVRRAQRREQKRIERGRFEARQQATVSRASRKRVDAPRAPKAVLEQVEVMGIDQQAIQDKIDNGEIRSGELIQNIDNNKINLQGATEFIEEEIVFEDQEADILEFGKQYPRGVGEAENKAKKEHADKDIEQEPEIVATPVIIDARIAPPPPPPPPSPVRVLYYRPREFPTVKYEAQRGIPERTDFRSTLYWNGHVKVDRTGTATLKFFTSDAITSFNITAEGIGTDGTIGRATHKFFAQLPFSMNAKIPVEVVTGDKVKIPLTFVNNTDEEILGDLDFTIPDGFKKLAQLPQNLTLAPHATRTSYLEFLVEEACDKTEFGVELLSNGFADAVRQPLRSVSRGFPAGLAFSNQEMNATYEVDINDVVDGSLEVTLTAFPDLAGELMSGLESMLREPHGCFEQTSSATYPNILVLQYMNESDQIKPEIAERAKALIERGYKRLTSFESKGGGFEWFGGNPAHEGLTAYGLMEFADMQQVWNGVDQAMIDRTADWLMSRRDGQGEFERNPRALHSFGLTDNATMSAYITYGLTEAGYDGLKKEIDAAYKHALSSKNPYAMGLAANILFNKKDKKRGAEVLGKLMKLQGENGAWTHDDKHKSGPGSQGQALRIETASLALMALLKQDNPDLQATKKIADFIRNSRGGYAGFGNTNSTVLALRSLIAYTKFAKQTQDSGEIEFLVNNKKVTTQKYEKGTQGTIDVTDLHEFVKEGKQDLTVRFKGTKNALPYTLAINWNTTLPHSNDECVIDLETKLNTNRARVGETVRLTTTIKNKTNEGQAMTLGIVGLPAGLTAQPWQLKELLDKELVDFYEIIGNNVVFYFRDMAPAETHTINLDLKAEMPGEFDAPASSGYLYYTNEFKDWDSVETVVISQ